MIYQYKLYIFDLDGTIIDSEYSHYQAYNNQLINKISYSEYQDIFHDENKKKQFLIENSICKIKKEEEFIEIYNKNAKLVEGFETFFYELIELGKDIVIATNSSEERMSYILSKHPILNNVNKIVSKKNMVNIKPNPECYINIINDCKYSIDEIIIFEDSYTGFKSLERIDSEKIFICHPSYFYYNNINSPNKYTSYINISSLFTPCNQCHTKQIYDTYNDNYINTLLKNKSNMLKIHTLLKCIILTNSNKNLYIVGIGKSNFVSKKCASTWRSLGINVHNLDCEDLWHGGFGIFNNTHSLIIYLSNSGNTEELINVATHIKKTFTNVLQLCLTLNSNCKISKVVNYTFNLLDTNNVFNENGVIKKAPSISSFIFMNFLDNFGIILNNQITTSTFVMYHPGGSLGSYSSKIDYVIISCCGKGTRLMPITSCIPKSLVNIDNDNILSKQIKYWMKYTDNFIVINDKKYNNIVDFYLKSHNVNYTIQNVEINNNEENAYTLQQTVSNCQSLINKKVVITWCDILITDDLDLNLLNENTIFTYGNESRYYCEKNNIYKREYGNVIGCFYIDKMKKIINNDIKNDFCDIFIENFKKFNVYQLNNLIDVGDMNKLDSYLTDSKTNYKTRFFNNIEEIDNNKLKKKSTDNYGKTIIEREIKYYKYIQQYKLNFPKIYLTGENYFVMEKLENYTTLNKLELNETNIRLVFENIKLVHDCKNKAVDKITYDTDLKIEFYHKILERFTEIEPLINFIQPDQVNSLPIDKNINSIVSDLYSKIYEKLKDKNEYNLIHGDCQFSNTLYNENTNSIFLVDPRGYFGKTMFFGVKEYDYSKILYSFSGYDNFNNNDKYYFTYENNNLTTNINYDDIFKFKHIFQENNIDFELCLYIVIVHWLSLASYSKNNINKCIASYYQGLFLYKKLL